MGAVLDTIFRHESIRLRATKMNGRGMRPGGASGLQIRQEVLSISGGFDSHPLRHAT